MAGEYVAHLEKEVERLKAEVRKLTPESKWEFNLEPNIWGDPEDPDYWPRLSRYEVINGGTYVCYVDFTELMNVPFGEWHEYLENTWNKFVNEGDQ